MTASGFAAESVAHACAFKAAIVAGDEREEKRATGARCNLGHTFAHALEAEYGYDGELLQGEAVAVGLGLAFGSCRKAGGLPAAGGGNAHVAACGLPAELTCSGALRRPRAWLPTWRRDKKMRDGRLAFVLARDIGEAFTSRDVPEAAALSVLRNAGCAE